MSGVKDGGPAFPPNGGWTEDSRPHDGMSLRDWFAGQALPEFATLISIKHSDETAKVIAELSYKMADAMLAAR